MTEELKNTIRNNQYLYQYLREESFEYKNIYRKKDYIKKLKSKAQEKYHLRKIDKIVKISNSMNLIKTFISVLD